MDLALMIAKSGLDAHHRNLEIVSNNLANSSTTAFKRNRGEFEDLPYQMIKPPGQPSNNDMDNPTGLMIGTGVKMTANTKLFMDGPAIITSRDKNIRIQGRGFLQVQMPDGNSTGYTRDGTLQVNDQGQLTDHNGYIIQPPLTIPQGYTQLSIAQDGTVSAQSPGNSTLTQIGQLQLADFMNPEGLQSVGQNLYLETEASGQPVVGNPAQNGLGTINQGELEGSNVNVVEEMVNLIEAQRAFEVTSKAISAADNMLNYINQTT